MSDFDLDEMRATYDRPSGKSVIRLLERLEQAEQDRDKLRNRLDAMRRQRDGYRNQLRKTEQQTNRHEPTKEKTMSSKTFKCVEHEEEVLEVYPFTGDEAGRKFSLLMPHVSSNAGITFDSTTAPALALAILEAAGYKEEQGNETTEAAHHFGMSMLHLRFGIKEQEYITAEAEAQEKLEVEALELYNVCMTGHSLSSFNGLGGTLRDQWLAVARRARELNKEENNA